MVSWVGEGWVGGGEGEGGAVPSPWPIAEDWAHVRLCM